MADSSTNTQLNNAIKIVLFCTAAGSSWQFCRWLILPFSGLKQDSGTGEFQPEFLSGGNKSSSSKDQPDETKHEMHQENSRNGRGRNVYISDSAHYVDF
jgi:hypothetical protein